jgi:hypothetical protein
VWGRASGAWGVVFGVTRPRRFTKMVFVGNSLLRKHSKHGNLNT